MKHHRHGLKNPTSIVSRELNTNSIHICQTINPNTVGIVALQHVSILPFFRESIVISQPHKVTCQEKMTLSHLNNKQMT